MRLGYVTFEPMDIPAAVEAAATYGFDFLELQMAYVAAGTPQLGREYLDGRVEEIRSLLGDHGVDLLVHLPHTMDIGASSDRIRAASVEETKACLRTAASLGAEKCVLHPTSSARTRVWPPEAIQDQVLTSVRELDGFARDRDVAVCVENVPHSVFPIHEFGRFFAACDCAMTLDTGHARVSGLDAADIAAFAEANRDRIGHVHANDNKAFVTEANDAPSDDHVPTGAGDLDFGVALAPLQDGWNGTVSLEVHTASLEYIELAKRHMDRMLDRPAGG